MRSILPSLATQGFVHLYKQCGYNIVLDIASGSVHSADDVTYDVIQLIAGAGTSRQSDCAASSAPAVPDAFVMPPEGHIISRIKQAHPDATDSGIRAILADVNKLIAAGKLFSSDTFDNIAEAQSAAEDMPVKALCLNVSHACNMKCAYCFVSTSLSAAETRVSLNDSAANHNKTPDSSLLTPDSQTPDSLMPFDTGKQAIDFLIANSGTHKTLDIDFFGGEPLLNWKTVKEIVAYARMAEKFTGKKFRFTLTTNGLLIDDDVISFTNKEFHNVVLSLDGRPETHNAMRKVSDKSDSLVPANADTLQIETDVSIYESGYKTGQGSYDAVLPKIKKMVEQRRGKGYYIRGTFTRRNMDFSNDILHLAGLGFNEISLEPVITKQGDPLGFTKDDLPELMRQYDILAVEMRKRKDDMAYVRPQDIPKGYAFNFYHYNLDLECSPCIHKRIKGCGVATEYMAVTPDGKLYPCHQFVGDEAFLLGDVRAGITNEKLRKEFASASIYSRAGCRACWARFYCSGGCAANAFNAAGSINGIYELGCELFKKRIENAIMLKF